jgi:uncharacterized membrane protein YeaQ/YmgE (transglycosylase-associated protein family)
VWGEEEMLLCNKIIVGVVGAPFGKPLLVCINSVPSAGSFLISTITEGTITICIDDWIHCDWNSSSGSSSKQTSKR